MNFEGDAIWPLADEEKDKHNLLLQLVANVANIRVTWPCEAFPGRQVHSSIQEDVLGLRGPTDQGQSL